jgi:dolichol-phosphate mannosyltransferase
VIPARDEEGCIVSTVEHLHLELRMQGIPHEIVVVDDGSTDSTWRLLGQTAGRIPELAPVQNPGPHGFGRAIQRGLAAFTGDAVVISWNFAEAAWDKAIHGRPLLAHGWLLLLAIFIALMQLMLPSQPLFFQHGRQLVVRSDLLSNELAKSFFKV